MNLGRALPSRFGRAPFIWRSGNDGESGGMIRASRHALRVLVALFLSIALLTRPAMAQSILRDAETEKLFHDISAPLIEAAGLDPRNVQIVLIGDDSINAFVAGGQVVYIHSGLLVAADNVGQVQGVIAHELGHIEGGHVVRFGDGIKQATGISIVSLLLGGLALAAGAGEAGLGIMQAGQRAALGSFLAFTRTQESSADMAGARYLSAAGVSGRGSLEFFGKLKNQEIRAGIKQDGSYDRTHPLSGERIAALTDVYMADPAWNTPNDPMLEARFERVRAKLLGYVNPERALRDYPHGDNSLPAHYARAYAYHQGGYPTEAMAEAQSLVSALPDDPFVLELQGQILLEGGHPDEALPALRRAVQLAPDQPMIATTLGHALVATENRANYDEAKVLLKQAVTLDRENPFAWLQLGTIYEAEGDEYRAALASAERQFILGQYIAALRSATHAMQGIPAYSPDWLRAQDIAMVSENEAKKAKNKDKK